MSTLAEMTSLCVEIFHRVGELLTVNETREPFREAELLQKWVDYLYDLKL